MEGNEPEYREVIKDCVNWFEPNHLHINAGKTKEMVRDFHRKKPPTTLLNIQGLFIEMVGAYIYSGVHLSNKLDWSDNTDALYKNSQRPLHMQRRLRSFPACRTLL